MKALTIRQPWAWAIFNGGKDIENRTWYTPVRGRVAIHAAVGVTRKEYESATKYIWTINRQIEIPYLEHLQRGVILGVVEIADCVRDSDSVWFQGKYGLTLARPKLLREAIPWEGGLKLWNVPGEVEERIKRSILECGEHAHYPHTKRPRASAMDDLTCSKDWRTAAGGQC